MAETPRLVLASQSATRRSMLEAAGVLFTSCKPDVDEAVLKADWLRDRGQAALENLALALAEAKASNVSKSEPQALVLGADQVLALGDRVFSKSANRVGAQDVLRALRGQTHALHTAAALAMNGQIVWRHVETAHMTVRDFSDAWLENYLDAAGEALTRSVGAYELEGPGAQLFGHVEGSTFTVLGLPLLPLLKELRARGVLEQ